VPEYVQDGVVDCGITGQDLVRERGARVDELLELGFGSCRLEAAVPEESRYKSLEDLAGSTIASVYPRLTRELLPVEVELVDVTGSVEIAPRLGLADGIVDLVSSGNTLRTNGLRSLGSLFSSQAVLIGKPGAEASQLVSEKKTKKKKERIRWHVAVAGKKIYLR
jgi:ATP phosphoribosyltransferase